MSREFNLGPGTLRVGRFIGRLGVVSLPAVAVGLDLDDRVIRRHVAKLQTAGWLERAPWIWGEGSVAWLTAAGMHASGLGAVRAVRSPPGTTTITHGALVGWTAARVERNGRTWKSLRELQLDPDRWAVPARCERGYTTQLPDLAAWLDPAHAPIAVIVESGGRREDRQKLILEGWRDATIAGRYSGVLYDCASQPVAHWINRLARKVQLDGPAFTAAVQKSVAEIMTASSPAPANERSAATPSRPAGHAGADQEPQVHEETAMPVPQPSPREPAGNKPTRQTWPVPDRAELEQRYREILGIEERRPKRPWRR